MADGARTATALTCPGVILGTPHYLAPEQVSGLAAGPAADIFAAGDREPRRKEPRLRQGRGMAAFLACVLPSLLGEVLLFPGPAVRSAAENGVS